MKKKRQFIDEICALHANGHSISQIASEYCISIDAVKNLVRRCEPAASVSSIQRKKRNQEIIDLVGQGFSASYIHRVLGSSYPTILKAANSVGINLTIKKRAPLTDAQRKAITEMRQQGLTYQQIADNLSLCQRRIARFCRKSNLGGSAKKVAKSNRIS